MSLSRTVLRMLAVKALTGRTLAGANVSDSAIEPIDVKVENESLPIITVVTDDDLSDVKGRDFSSGERQLDLVIEVAVAAEVNNEQIVIPHTDFGLEWSIDIMEHQIDRALWGGESDWSQALMKMVPRIHRKASRRGSSAEKGVRFAARQIVYTVEPLSDPVLGRPLTDNLPFGAALTLIEANSETKPLGEAIRTMIEQPELSSIAASILTAAMTAEGAEAIRVADLANGKLLEEVTISDEQGNVLLHEVIRAGAAEIEGGGSTAATATKV